MSQPAKSRREKLEEMVAAGPENALSRYALAIECGNQGDEPAATAQFEELLRRHPQYVTGWFQYGLFLARVGRTDEARQTLTRGIAVAEQTGDTHAADEMRAARDDLG
jgi:Tfp pilus assembly protein PilF